MGGAVDLFSGSNSITGANLFTVDKNPLDQLFEGIDDVIGKQAGNLGANLVTGVLSYVQKIAGAIIDAILGLPLELLSSIEPALLESFQNVDKFFTNTLSFLGGLDPLSDVFTIEAAAQNFINSVLAETGLLPILSAGHLTASVLQPFIDAIAQGFGLSSGLNFSSLETGLGSLIGNIQQLVAQWAAALALIGVSTPTNFVELLRGLIPAAIPQFNGTAIATTVDGFVDNLNGTISYTIQEGQNEVAHLIQQADGTVVTAAQVAQQIVAAAQSAQVAVGQAVATGQQMADHGIAAIEGAAVQAGQTAQAYGASLTGAFASWVNSWTGQQLTQAAAPDVSAAAAAAALAASNQATQTSAINAQLPHFYGGSGTAGLDAQVTFSGSLPGTFTSVSTIAGGSAKYNTAASTDQQTVSGIWSATDANAKYLFLRGNSGFTTYAYAKIQNNAPFTGAANCEIGCVVGGIKTVFTTFTLPSGGSLVANSVYAFEVTDYAFSLTGPNGLSVAYTDGSHVSQKGPLYVYGGFGTDGKNLGTLTVGAGTFGYTVPAGMVSGDKFDIVAVGGGGGARGDSNGGAAGAWNAIILTYGTDFPTSTTSFTVTGGTGGAGGAYPLGAPGNGSASSVAITGYASSPFAAAGGVGAGATGGIGDSPGNFTFDNDGYAGGASQPGVYPATGNAPGAGGNGSLFGSNQAGGGGGGGQVLITARTLTLPGSLASWAFYDSGPGAGPATANVATSESTSSTTYADLATTTDQVTVNVGPSGIVLVILNATVSFSSGSGPVGLMSFAASGTNTIAASDTNSATGGVLNINTLTVVSGIVPLFGLSPGATTFKAKHRTTTGTISFTNRSITAIPL